MLAVVEREELRRAADTEHYALARRLHRTLISLDRDFFDESRFPMVESGGVIILAAPDERGLTSELARVDRAFFRTGGRRTDLGSGAARSSGESSTSTLTGLRPARPVRRSQPATDRAGGRPEPRRGGLRLTPEFTK